MVRLFFIFWIRSNIFRHFSGCRRPIFKCFDIIRFVFPLAFQRRILNCSTAKTRAATTKTKHEVENRLFFIFWVRCNLLRDLSGSRRPIFKYFYIIRFVFPLAFQRRIRNCSTANICAATTKNKTQSRKRWLGFSSFFGFAETYFEISQAPDVRFLNVFISLDLPFH